MAQRVSDIAPAAISGQVNSASRAKPLGVLGWIAGYKLLKAILALAGAIVVWKLGHRDLVVVANNLMLSYHIAPDGWVATKLVARLANLHPDKLHLAAQLLLLYAVLYSVEAVGLFFEKHWAEWLTVVQTSLLLPVEIYELICNPGLFALGAFVTSSVVVAYLIWRIYRDWIEEHKRVSVEA